MKFNICIIPLTFVVMTAATSALALTSDSLRCNGGLVSIGDAASVVVSKCGQPTYATQREEKVVDEIAITGDRVIATTLIDDWTYNFGPDRFQYRILLKDARVWQIESLGYGY